MRYRSVNFTRMCCISYRSEPQRHRPQLHSILMRTYLNHLIHVIKTNLIHYLSSVYFSQSLHVSGIIVTHHQEVYCI